MMHTPLGLQSWDQLANSTATPALRSSTRTHVLSSKEGEIKSVCITVPSSGFQVLRYHHAHLAACATCSRAPLTHPQQTLCQLQHRLTHADTMAQRAQACKQ
eukprot:scaffold18401_cov21-Tisochrysis_lutea.AAC.1